MRNIFWPETGFNLVLSYIRVKLKLIGGVDLRNETDFPMTINGTYVQLDERHKIYHFATFIISTFKELKKVNLLVGLLIPPHVAYHIC